MKKYLKTSYLLRVGRALRCGDHLPTQGIVVRVAVGEDDAVQGGPLDDHVIERLSLQLGEYGIPSPRMSGENGIVVAKPDGEIFHVLKYMYYLDTKAVKSFALQLREYGIASP